uniref:Uncharacterized protein n=1 Tax=Romanomermis culicivorax TaxID=13658 RepID=A0A915IFP8_ROMCU
MDHLAEMLIAAFHNVALMEVLPAKAIDIRLSPKSLCQQLCETRFSQHTKFSCSIVYRPTMVSLFV